MAQVQGYRSAGGAQVSMMGNGWRGTPRQAVLGQVVPRVLVGASRVRECLCGAEADAPAIVDGVRRLGEPVLEVH